MELTKEEKTLILGSFAVNMALMSEDVTYLINSSEKLKEVADNGLTNEDLEKYLQAPISEQEKMSNLKELFIKVFDSLLDDISKEMNK